VTLRTRLTERLNITHPVLLAPMGSVSGGRLAGAVSEAGGLGLIGGGYGDKEWLEREFAAAGNRRSAAASSRGRSPNSPACWRSRWLIARRC
jgi:nitronate monooxygenase